MYRDFKSEEKLIDALNIYQEKWVESLPDDSELEHITFSKKFENRIHKLLINKEKEQKENKEGSVIYFSTTFKRVTSLLLASVMFVVVVLFSVTALRETFFGLLRKDNYISTTIFFSDDPAFDPNCAFVESHFTVPSEFERTGYNYSIDFFRTTYKSDRGNYLQIYQGRASGGGTLQLDTEGCEIEKVKELGSSAIYYEKRQHCLFWQKSSSYYLIQSDLSKDEIIEIALTVEY